MASSTPVKVSVPDDMLPLVQYLAEDERVSVPVKIIQLADQSLKREEDRIFSEIMDARLDQADSRKPLTLDQFKDAFSF